jgi:hypothetical protein
LPWGVLRGGRHSPPAGFDTRLRLSPKDRGGHRLYGRRASKVSGFSPPMGLWKLTIGNFPSTTGERPSACTPPSKTRGSAFMSPLNQSAAPERLVRGPPPFAQRSPGVAVLHRWAKLVIRRTSGRPPRPLVGFGCRRCLWGLAPRPPRTFPTPRQGIEPGAWVGTAE